MDGFKRPTPTPKQDQQQPVGVPGSYAQQQAKATPPAIEPPMQNEPEPSSQPTAKSQKRRPKRWVIVILALLFLSIVVAIGAAVWYVSQLKPVNVNADEGDKQQFVIEDGASFAKVSESLETKGLIRNSLAFNIMARLQSKRSQIQAGTCSMDPTFTAQVVLDKLTSGCEDFISITFYPGATIEKPFYKSPSATLSQTLYVKNVLREAGFSDEAIKEGLNADYEGPLFAGKPADTTLEGYIYGETYYIDTEASVASVLRVSFDEMYKVISENNLEEAYKKQGLDTLYDGITMASIVQRELNCEDKPTPERKDKCYGYQQTIAQVLLKRLREGIPLGADVTFIYAADQAQQQPTIDFDSPYNTRINKGLPPGPIGAPGELALKAVANPSDTDYLYFVAGDDGLIYFSKTQEEHEKNTREHCQILCFELE